MTYQLSPAQRNDGRLWALAFGLSLLLNAVILLLAGISILHLERFRPVEVVTKPAERIQIIAPELAPQPPDPSTTAAEPVVSPPSDPPFARTSDDQRSERPDRPKFIGERNTQATSDATPDPNAPEMPAQAGIDPRYPGDIETTESRYQDGEMIPDSPLGPDAPTTPAPLAPTPPVVPPATANKGVQTTTPGTADEHFSPPPPERLATSSHPVEIPVPKPVPDENPKPGPVQREKEGQPEGQANQDEIKETPVPSPPQNAPKPPAFRGYQRKTAIHGSISRTGRSALDVEDNALGRYQAVISRAVELEWQRNCVRYRDFITPGFLTVRFFVDAKGKVRSVDFIEVMKSGPKQQESGQQQKGFTLNSIREAAIPAMPPELRKDFQDEPLELIFNFYF